MKNLDCLGLPGPPGPSGRSQKGDKGESGSPVSEYYVVRLNRYILIFLIKDIDKTHYLKQT